MKKRMVVTPNYEVMESLNLNAGEMLLLAAMTIMVERGFFRDAVDLHGFAVSKLEDEERDPWFVDHSVDDDIPTVLVYRKQEHVNGPAILTIKELA